MFQLNSDLINRLMQMRRGQMGQAMGGVNSAPTTGMAGMASSAAPLFAQALARLGGGFTGGMSNGMGGSLGVPNPGVMPTQPVSPFSKGNLGIPNPGAMPTQPISAPLKPSFGNPYNGPNMGVGGGSGNPDAPIPPAITSPMGGPSVDAMQQIMNRRNPVGSSGMTNRMDR